jgi:CheY-like chemotaxis protein
MSSKKILLIEDDSDIRRNMKRLLELEGYTVQVAENGHIGLKSLQAMTELPALIILDLTMPVMDGFEFRVQQKLDSRIADVPVAIMTADGKIDEKRVRTAANVAIKKPADIDTIIAIVRQFC